MRQDEVGLTFVGHATFMIETPQGVRIATDYSDGSRPTITPDVATMNKAHSTHFSSHPDPAIKHVLRGWNPAGGPAVHDLTVQDVRIRNVYQHPQLSRSDGIRRPGLDSWSGGRNDWSSVMDDIRRLSPDVIVTSSHGWTRALSAVISTTPIIVSALSPVEQGIISSLARPTGNVTGIAVDLGPDFYSKQLDLLLEAAPNLSHVAFLSAERVYRGMRQLWREANQRGVSIQEFHYMDDYEAVLKSMVLNGAKAVLILADANHVRRIDLIARLAQTTPTACHGPVSSSHGGRRPTLVRDRLDRN